MPESKYKTLVEMLKKNILGGNSERPIRKVKCENDIPYAFQSGKCDNTGFLLVRDTSVMGFMPGGMVAGTVPEGVQIPHAICKGEV